ncbi:MAG: MoxR family ATPase [Desulfurococcales archaeon]|nr:MoxR family ATPase [Desulfurococcales archaeon]
MAQDNRDIIQERVIETYGPLIGKGRPVRDAKRAVEILKTRYKLLVDEKIVALTFAAFMNGRPVLFEGPPGTGKTEIGEALLEIWSGKKPFILPCSENYDEYKVIGDFHPIIAIRKGFNEESFIPRPLLAALILDTGILVDEIRRSNEDFQNMLLDIADKRRIIVPELRRVFHSTGSGFQIIFTSNPEDIAQNDLSDAFLRRVVRIKFNYPPRSVEAEIIRIRSGDGPSMSNYITDMLLEVVTKLRKSGITHKPGTAEAVLWARIAKSIAMLRGSKIVEITDLLDAAQSVLAKRVEDEDIIMDTIKEVLGVEATSK